ncbi:MAG: glucokinase [Hellea sp.]|nr:glucokinase [Hellea sp.]
MADQILTADIGGTNARFGLAERQKNGRWEIAHFAKFRGDDFKTFTDVLDAYLEPFGGSRPRRAIFSVAGPVENGKVTLTNRSWSLDSTDLKKRFGLTKVYIVNDFAAMTRSIPELTDEDLIEIKPGRADKSAPILVAGPGTGFGVGYLIPVTGGYHVLTTEGGHQAYSPQTDRELELLKILRSSFGFISVERVSSGSGMVDVHKAVSQRQGKSYHPESPAIIREKARQGDPVALEVCEIRAAATMGAMGDLALSGGARGGVVLAGGVSERMIEFFKSEDAMSRFLKRGKRSDYMADIPIYLLSNARAALYGAAALFEDLETRAS